METVNQTKTLRNAYTNANVNANAEFKRLRSRHGKVQASLREGAGYKRKEEGTCGGGFKFRVREGPACALFWDCERDLWWLPKA
ncbi:hypothetical protein VNO77_02862 [Canavalia gladiata]|uniref:Uncharacterized protein n=1 Tax=Canavalia gladiata TaxID=3824 RepID=A0AAN9R6G5_CANGL